MISSTFTSVTFVIRLLLFTSCLFNNFVFTTKPLSDGLQDLRNDWKDTLIQNKSIDFSDRKEASFSGPLRTDEKFQQIKLSPPLRDFGYPALVSDGTELHAKIILIRANLNVKDEETVVNFIRSFVKGTHGHKITDMTAFDWNDDNVCVFFEFWSWYVEHQLTALRNGWRKAEYKQVRYEHFDDHSKTKLIGKGNYGKVYLVKRRKDNKDFAMKDMLVDNVFTETKRDLSYRKRRIDYMFSEVDVLTDIKTEFTTDMVGFDIEVDPNNRRKYSIVIFLEYVSGGELFDYIEWWRDRHNEAHITKSTPATGIAVPEWIARDFFVQLATAVQKIHEAGIGHRDIKPENILIDEKGRVQLTDFGLAKRFNGGYRSDIGVGSLHYMAPELVGIDYYGQIVHNPKHNQLVDWWSLTTVLYSILTCRSAFGGVSNQETTSNIVKGKVHRLFSHQKRFISGECWNFMIRMLQPDMRRRLSRNGLSEEFMRDPWFGAHHGMKAIDWKNVKDMPMKWIRNEHSKNSKDLMYLIENHIFTTIVGGRALWEELVAWRNNWRATVHTDLRRIDGYRIAGLHSKIDVENITNGPPIEIYYAGNEAQKFTLKVHLFGEFGANLDQSGRNVDVEKFLALLDQQKSVLDTVDWKSEKIFVIGRK